MQVRKFLVGARLASAVWLTSAGAATLAGCHRDAPKAPTTAAPAAPKAVALPASATPSAAPAADAPAATTATALGRPGEAQPGPLLRTWLADFAADRPVGLIGGPEQALVVQAAAGDSVHAAAIDAIGRPIWQGTLTAESATPAAATATPAPGAMLAVQAGSHAWAGAQGSHVLAHWSPSGQGSARRVPMPLVGLVGQLDGTAVVVLRQADGARAARLHSDGGPVWEVAVPLPGSVTAAVATLRGDTMLLGRPAPGGRDGWSLVRLAGSDGQILWQRHLDPAQLPASAELQGIASAPSGMALLTSGLHPSNRKEPWSLLLVDANGGVAKVHEVPRAAPEAIVTGDTSLVALGQARDGGLWLETWNGPLQSRYRAPWLGLEKPLAISHGGGIQLWAISSVWPGGRDGDRLLLTRLQFDVGQLHSQPCATSSCTATWQTGPDCAELAAHDGSPCGPGATCWAGRCGAAPRP